MRVVIVLLALLAFGAAPADALTTAQLKRELARQISSAGSASGAYVENLATGERMFSSRAGAKRIPASVEKLYTTIGAQAKFGDDGILQTVALATRRVTLDGTLDGDLYLRGEGDPGLASDDLKALARTLKQQGLSEVTGRVVGDESAFDARRGPPSEGFRASQYVSPLGALMVNRGLSGKTSPYYQPSPPKFAANLLTQELEDLGVEVDGKGRAGRTPDTALSLAGVDSASMADLLKAQNVVSDNYIAEMLLKATGMTETTAGTTRRGAAVVQDTAADLFGISPTVIDGSGLSRGNATSPREVVELLAQKFDDPVFFDSLAIAGVSGTLAARLKGAVTRGDCRGKTGTLSDVSNLAGYCETRGGDTLAFAILNNRISPTTAHGIQDRMVNAIARFGG